jgi:dihydroxy-acid dehydratase
LAGFLHRSALRAEGIPQAALDGRPVIGICNSWSELVNCNVHFRALAQAVRRGILEAGGLPLEFPTLSLGENLMKPTTMLYRNLMSMDVEECIRAYPLDAVVLVGGCDKTIPAQLMGAASADVPAICVTGGPSLPAVFRGRQLGAGTDIWRYTDELRAGRMTEAEYAELEAAATPSPGHCPEMGTASTMAALTEALGMSLPGHAAIPAMNAERLAAAEGAGRRSVELALEDLRPSEVLRAGAFDNAAALLLALGGSTNAVIHLLALAGRVRVHFGLDRFAEAAARTPVIVNVRPSGEHLFEHVHRAGGIPAVLKELQPLLTLESRTVTGLALGENLPERGSRDPRVIASLHEPFQGPGGIAVLRGNLAPSGALIKTAAASQSLLRHRGPAVVFDGIEDLQERIDDQHLAVEPHSVLVLRQVGPRGAPGMPEWGQIPIPSKLLRSGVSDMVRLSDARMSGTAFGTVILHVAPEAAVGGPLAAVRTGDTIAVDVPAGRLTLEVDDAVILKRLAEESSPRRHYRRGYGALFEEHVLQADLGCDFDFLRGDTHNADPREPYGLLSGWLGGW